MCVKLHVKHCYYQLFYTNEINIGENDLPISPKTKAPSISICNSMQKKHAASECRV